ncbi:MAG: 50S ribosomal protein L39e [Candidatus Micrarchaeota archaeon]|nr:50S ribosomal protein L39e [Candidatus Micrarchaeota archaeon]
MAKNKTQKNKKILGKAIRQNRRVPIFVMAKTNRHVTRNPLSRHWKTRKLKLKRRAQKV